MDMDAFIFKKRRGKSVLKYLIAAMSVHLKYAGLIISILIGVRNLELEMRLHGRIMPNRF